jgi:hypothetical protein
MRKGVGVALVAGGVLLAWLLKKKMPMHVFRVHERDVVVGDKSGRCGLRRSPSPVRLSKPRGDQLHWILWNEGGPCGSQVEIWMTNWSPRNPLEDRGDHPEQPFKRRVQKGAPVRMPAHIRQDAEAGTYRYDVFVNGQLAEDPMLEIVI